MIKTISQLFIITLAFCITISCNGTEEDGVLVGKYTWAQWQEKAGWSDYSAANYTPNQEALASIKAYMEEHELNFIIFGANWCLSDCATQMPKIMKLIAATGFVQDSVQIYGIDRQKTEPSGMYATYQIARVPTLIILENGNELGRVVENPKSGSTWENDIWNILK